MKKVLFLILCALLCCPCVIYGEETELTPQASASVLMDYDSREILYEKNMHEKLYPASMTKMMSLYLVLKAIHQGVLKWEDSVTASSHAAKMGGSQIYLEEGEQMSVLDLFKASTVASANDAITALAEKVSGSESAFVNKMNETAVSFGCKDTHFVNPTGLHDENHVSSAYDMALIASYLIEEGQDELLQYTSLLEDYIREDSEQKFWLVNTNKMLRSYQGMDGLKTGYTSQSLYCITVTALRDGMRLIAVVMHEPDKNTRSKEAAALLDYGFANYQVSELIKENEFSEVIQIDKGIPNWIEITNRDALKLTHQRTDSISETDRKIILKELHPPIQTGELVGEMILQLSNGKNVSSSLIAKQASDKMTFWPIFIHCLEQVIF